MEKHFYKNRNNSFCNSKLAGRVHLRLWQFLLVTLFCGLGAWIFFSLIQLLKAKR